MHSDEVNNEQLPATIGMGTSELAPLLVKWRQRNRGVPWSELIRRGVKKELKELAGKRYAHLIGEFAPVLFFCIVHQTISYSA